MGQRCSVCTHDQAHSINVSLVHREPYRAIARQYEVSKDALTRHVADHLPQLLVKAKEAVEVAEAGDLLGEVRDLHDRTLTLLSEAEQGGRKDRKDALAAIREARSNLELVGRLTKELDSSPTVNIMIAPQVQQVILSALASYPEARLAVASAIGELRGAS